jgi:membrane fusion protein (multidrug efflux system)
LNISISRSPFVRARFAQLIAICLAFPSFAQPPPSVPVVAIEARLELVTETVPLTGTVTARQQASLSPRASGLVHTVYVDAGSYVRQGDKLVSLDAALAELGVQSADASRAEAQARLAESERLLNESRRLLTTNSIPETELMNRQAAAAIAAAAAQRAEVTYLERAELLQRHHVIAPFDGVITQKLTEAGEWVSTGASVLQLVSLQGSRIDVQVPQERLQSITTETTVDFVLDSASGAPRLARIVALVPVSNPATRTALVRIEPVDDSISIPPGKSARVFFHLRSEQAVLTVPRDALIRRSDGTTNVWVALPAGDHWQATMRRVDLGRTYTNQIEIVDGVEPGQHIIIRGNETVREGQAVHLVAP